MAAPKKIFEFAEKAKEQITGDENLYIPIPGINNRVKLSTLLAWLQEQGMDGLWQVTGTGENTALEAIPVAPIKITAPEATNKQLAGLAIDAEGKVQKISALEFITLTDAAEVDWDMNDSPFAQVTLGGNRELVITNPKPGAVVLIINQDATGGREITFPAGSKYIMGFSINPQAESQTVVTGFYNGTGWLWNTAEYAETYQPQEIIKTQLLNLGTKSANFAINLARDSRQEVIIDADLQIDFENLPESYSSTVLIDITASGARTISWNVAIPTTAWVDGMPLTAIADGDTYCLSISTLGSLKSDLLINWVKRG